MGRDFTLHASISGHVSFSKSKHDRTYVNVLPLETVAPAAPAEPKAKAKPQAVAQSAPVAEEIIVAAPVTPEVIEETAPAPKTEKKAAKPAAEKPAKAASITLPSGKKVKQDDLKIVEGIGPKIEELLHNAGITTWAELAAADVEKVRQILDEAGSKFNMHDPATWGKQAQLAHEGQWEALATYQDELKGGKEE